jgi:hypothetical protein
MRIIEMTWAVWVVSAGRTEREQMTVVGLFFINAYMS